MERDAQPSGVRPVERPRAVTSPWAIAALMCSLVVVCPLATLLGPLLGVKAISEIRARPGLKGMPLAVLSIVLGLGITVFWFFAAAWLNANVRQPVLSGPVDELRAGFAGDVARFREGFIDQVPEDVARAFIDELRARYGSLHGIEQDAAAPPPDADANAEPFVVHYVLSFQRDVVEAEAAYVPFEDFRPVGKWRWILIKDEALGDLRYPPGR